MGIQGLLPLLKPIQRRKHLSEFAGQTLAVDAYVWLHRGAYACAAELVQRRPTRRYVDFCMARVRLLRHHGIEPYLVFDGGPLPAKLGTEKEREKRREQNIKLANELMAQGKESQASEYYVKCVDVTPQMAYQVIKALKAEKVQYVVAPYEADAQLAFLERSGLVDGIITEDSDLLVFGCRNVHVKLDTVSATVVSISRADFGSPALAKSSFSLIGWSEAQFRWMAMLSGCDYLPSIGGVGLKTAYQLLKKYKAVDKAVKMIRLEGKKSVPRDYLVSFYLAEKVFLHQRVYDPRLRKLVYLSNPSDSLCLDEAAEMYIGRDLEPHLACQIAEGDACPISLTGMEDINPSFDPKPRRILPLQDRNMNSSRTPIDKTPCKKGGILNFFTPVAKPPPGKVQPSVDAQKDRPRIMAGNASGKRTLLDVMEQDIASKRKKVSAESEVDRSCKSVSTSRFFNGPDPSRIAPTVDTSEKENNSPAEAEIVEDPVIQEDGYLSPSPSLSRAGTPDVSSPVVSCRKISRHDAEAADDGRSQEVTERIFVRGSSEPIPDCHVNRMPGPDLAVNLAGDDDDDDQEADRLSEATSEILCWEDEDVDQQDEAPGPSRDGSLTPTTPVNHKPAARSSIARIASFDDPTDELELLEIDEEEERTNVQVRLAQKWRLTYSLGSRLTSIGSSITSHTNVDPRSSPKTTQYEGTSVKGRPPARTVSDSAINCVKHRAARGPRMSESRTSSRRNVHAPTDPIPKPGSQTAPILIDVDEVSDEVVCNSRTRLQAFRYRKFS